jgi:XapX domain-containing protein
LIELKALVTGVLVGVVFAIVKSPIPAPPTIAGILGIAGISFGFAIASSFKLWH